MYKPKMSIREHSGANWNLEVLVFEEYLGKNLSELRTNQQQT